MNKLKRFLIICTLFVLVTGTLAHFLYEWTGKNFIIGLFAPVSESTWEHMKLIFFPMLLLFPFIRRKFKADYPCITSAYLSGMILGTFLIPVLFYTYTGILGYNLFILDLLTFFFSVLAAWYAVYRLTVSCRMEKYRILLIGTVLILFLCFLIFTYAPPQIGLFANPM